jgi:hypothetical protein
MQYFTPQLLARYRSRDDDVADGAAQEWDQAVARYNEELDAIRHVLPSGARALIKHWSLHDAGILSITAFRRRPFLSVVIQLEGSPRRPGTLLELRYLLARTSKSLGFTIESHEEGAEGSGRIQYDEFQRLADEPVSVFSHSLLLQGAYELKIFFTDMRVRQLQSVILPSVEPLLVKT